MIDKRMAVLAREVERTCRTGRPGRQRRGSCAHCPGTAASGPASPPGCSRPPTRRPQACSGARQAAAPVRGTILSPPLRCPTAAAAGTRISCAKLTVRRGPDSTSSHAFYSASSLVLWCIVQVHETSAWGVTKLLSTESGCAAHLASPKSPIFTRPCSSPSPTTRMLDGFRSLQQQ